MDYMEKARILMSKEAYPDDHTIAAAQVYATLAQAEELRRIADALYVEVYDNAIGKRIVTSRIGL